MLITELIAELQGLAEKYPTANVCITGLDEDENEPGKQTLCDGYEIKGFDLSFCEVFPDAQKQPLGLILGEMNRG
jgi:hypothetical protein